jgi:hypothetical protein
MWIRRGPHCPVSPNPAAWFIYTHQIGSGTMATSHMRFIFLEWIFKISPPQSRRSWFNGNLSQSPDSWNFMGVQFLPVFHSFSPKVPKSINFQLPTASTFHRNVLLGSLVLPRWGWGTPPFDRCAPAAAGHRPGCRYDLWPQHGRDISEQEMVINVWYICGLLLLRLLLLLQLYMYIYTHTYMYVYIHTYYVYIYI